MVLPGIIVGILFLMPFIGRWKLGHGFNVAFILALFVGIGVLTWQGRREDSSNGGDQAAVADAEKKAERVKELVVLKGIGPAGAAHLLHEDSKTRGPVLFAAKC